MNKTELADLVAAKGQVSKGRASEAIDAMFAALTEALQQGEKIQIAGFGNFTVRERPARKGRNPQTGEALDLPASRAVGFKSAKGLLDPPGAPKPAPAADAPPAEAEDAGRRQHARARVEIEVEYFLVDKFISDYTRNISQGGLFIRSAQQLERGTELSFKLKVPRLDEPLTVKGRVSWVRSVEQAEREAKEPGMGVQFVYDSEEERREVERTVRDLIEDRGHTTGRAAVEADTRRTQSRLPVELKVEYTNLDLFITEYTRNISRGGLFIRSEQQLDPGTELLFKLHVPSLMEPLHLKGRVVWVCTAEEAGGAKQPGMGVTFVYDSPEDRDLLERAVELLGQTASD